MVIRNLLYDALNYASQVRRTVEEHHQKKDLRSGAEFLSGFTQKDKLIPVITLTIYWNLGGWDGPRSLHEMFQWKNDIIDKYVDNYHLHLIVPSEIRDYSKFTTDFRQVMEFISVSEDKDCIRKLLQEQHEAYERISTKTLLLLELVTNFKINIEEEKEEQDMCKGLEDWAQEEREIGQKIGQEIGSRNAQETVARNMFQNGFSYVQIRSCIPDLPESRLQELQEEVCSITL